MPSSGQVAKEGSLFVERHWPEPVELEPGARVRFSASKVATVNFQCATPEFSDSLPFSAQFSAILN